MAIACPVANILARDVPHSLCENSSHNHPEGEQGAGANRRGRDVGHACRNFNSPSRLHACPRPGGRLSLDVRRRVTRLHKFKNQITFTRYD